MRLPILFAVGTLLGSTAHALEVLYVTDSGLDKVLRFADLNSDGDYQDAGEVTTFYDDTLGPYMLSANNGICTDPGGTIYVADSTEDCIFAMRDTNADGDANDAGETTIFFDGRAGGNGSGVLMTSAADLHYEAGNSTFWVASSNTTAGGNDAILRVHDLNADGDANDVGEAVEYYVEPAGSVGDYIPSATTFGPDGKLYMSENGTLAGVRGIYRFDDLDNSGLIDQPGEKTFFFQPPAQAGTAFHWNMEVDANGWFYLTDTGNDLWWRVKDLNLDGDANDAGEFAIVWTAGVASNVWDLVFGADGTIYAGESQTPDRILHLNDLDANGTISGGLPETADVFNDTGTVPDALNDPRGLVIGKPLSVGTPYCFGDGTGTACPCGTGVAGNGCPNSLNPNGANLAGTGVASVVNDTVLFTGSGVPNGPGLYFQGTTQLGAGGGLAFGDGLRCAGGSVIRLGIVVAASNTSTYPSGVTAPNNVPVSIKGFCLSGDVRNYQLWYRDSDPVYCTGAVFNLTNAVNLVWQP